MEFKELNDKKEADLQKLLMTERGNLYDLRLKSKTGQVKNNDIFGKTKRNISRILTILNARKSEGSTN